MSSLFCISACSRLWWVVKYSCESETAVPQGATEGVLRSFWSDFAVWSSSTRLWLALYWLNYIWYYVKYNKTLMIPMKCLSTNMLFQLCHKSVLFCLKSQNSLLKNDQRDLKNIWSKISKWWFQCQSLSNKVSAFFITFMDVTVTHYCRVALQDRTGRLVG